MVVIIEDEPFLKDLMVAELQLQGRMCQSFSRLCEARDTLQNSAVTLVLADIGATNGGTMLLNLLRERKQYTPSVFFSGRPDWNFRSLFSLGAAAYFAKPFSRNALVRTITHLLSPDKDQWHSSPTTLPDNVIDLSTVSASIVWGSRGFCVSHRQVNLKKTNDSVLVKLHTTAPVHCIAKQVWHAQEESGWLIEDIVKGRDELHAQFNRADPWVAIPYTYLQI